jgi:hypothetical protein
MRSSRLIINKAMVTKYTSYSEYYSTQLKLNLNSPNSNSTQRTQSNPSTTMGTLSIVVHTESDCRYPYA